ncbi:MULTISPECIES: hypothetical protein [unclassified Blastococcus]
MTPPADARADREAFEAALAGRPAPAGAEALTAFTAAVRAEATAPGRPNAALAELLATGLLTDPSRTTVGRPAHSSRKRPRMILSTLAAKFAAAGAVAKAATAGGAVAAVALTGAATAQVLPIQDDTPAVVESGDATDEVGVPTDGTAPDDLTGEAPEGTGDEGAEGTGDEAPEDGEGDPAQVDVDVTTELTPESWAMGPQGEQTFSAWVSAGADAGLVRGEVVSCFAQARQGDAGRPGKPRTEDCIARFAPTPAEPEQEPVVPAPDASTGDSAPEVVEEETVEPAPAPAATGGSVAGNGHGNGGNGGGNGQGNAGGNGNGGNGGNGNGNRH